MTRRDLCRMAVIPLLGDSWRSTGDLAAATGFHPATASGVLWGLRHARRVETYRGARSRMWRAAQQRAEAAR